MSRCRRQLASYDLSRLGSFTPECFSNGAIWEELRDKIGEMIGDVRREVVLGNRTKTVPLRLLLAQVRRLSPEESRHGRMLVRTPTVSSV